MKMESVVGERKAGGNVQADVRGGAYSELIVNDVGLGRFFEAARAGRVFSVATAVAATLNGNAGALGAAGTAVVAISNPAGNAKAAAIIKASAILAPGASATPIAPLWYFIPAPSGVIAAGGAAAVNQLLGGPTSTMKTFINAALTGSLAATLLRPWWGTYAEPRHAGAASETGAGSIWEDTDGSIIVPPGCVLGVGFNVAGAAVTGMVGFTWAEIDWPL
jgi:hypothetical protein